MKQNKIIFSFGILIVFIISVSNVSAQFLIKSGVIGNGFGVMTNTDTKVNSTAGQSFIGKFDNTTYINQSGFWYSGYLITGVDDLMPILPGEFKLYQNYPNPFNPITHIKYSLPKASRVKIDIYNSLGQKLHTLVNEYKKAGSYITDFNGNQFASGLYFYRIVVDSYGETEEFSKVHKMILMK